MANFKKYLVLFLFFIFSLQFAHANAPEKFVLPGIQILLLDESGPTITSHPADQTVIEGETATFAVTASGTAPLSYQRWEYFRRQQCQLHHAADQCGR